MLKLLAFLAGAAGVVGFFLPLAEYRGPDGSIVSQTSAYEIATATTDTSGFAEIARGFGATPEQAAHLAETMQQGLLAYRGTIVAFYIPAALQALLGLFNLVRSRMGRFVGFLAILFGAANLAVFLFFYLGAQRQADPNSALGYGVWLLAAAGIGGALAGLGTMFAPDHD